jgi:hypothetical protein
MRLNLAIPIAIMIASAPLFAGCFTADAPRKPLAVQDHKCEQMGFKRGTWEYINCRFELARQMNPRGTTPNTVD